MRRTLVALIMALMVVVGSSSRNGSDPGPALDAATAADLQARVFTRACQDEICVGAQVHARDTTSDSVCRVILERYTDETEYLDEAEIEQRTSPEGRFVDGGTLVGIEDVHRTEQDNVIGVNTSISKRYRDGTGPTHLFGWNATGWVETSSGS